MPIRVTKIDAARRQLEAAIELYFAERDPVAVHTLASAAAGVLRDLATRAGHPDEVMDLVAPEHRRAVRDKLHEAQNFFKHADRDPEAALDFDPKTTEVVLFIACRQHALLAKNTVAMQCMFWWYLLREPDLLLDPATRQQAQELGSRMRHWDRRRFWTSMHEAMAEQALT